MSKYTKRYGGYQKRKINEIIEHVNGQKDDILQLCNIIDKAMKHIMMLEVMSLYDHGVSASDIARIMKIDPTMVEEVIAFEENDRHTHSSKRGK